jgi:hypothetical protein
LTSKKRRIASTVLVVLASVVLFLAVVVGYVRRAAIDSDQFANRATVALRSTAVRDLIAQDVTDRIVLAQQQDLIAVRPIIESAASGVVGSTAFTDLFRAGVRDLHSALFQDSQSTLTLTVADIGTVMAAALEQLRPGIADQVSHTASKVSLLSRNVGSLAADVAHAADEIRWAAFVLALLFIILAVAAVAVAPERRRAFIGLGIGAIVVGFLIAVALGIARSVAVHHVDEPNAQAAAGAVWDAFLGDLHTAAWIIAGIGAVTAATAASLIRPVEIDEPLRRIGRAIATEPQRPALRTVRGVALLGAGVFVLADMSAAVTVLLTLAGIYLVFAGMTILLRLVYEPEEEREVRAALAERPRWTLRRLAVPVLGAIVVVIASAAFVGSGGVSAPGPPAAPCDGSLELCDRPLNEVALPATHNSMSVPLPGWYSSEQDAPIPQQLHDGIRGLLIDTHYGDRLPDGKVRTDLDRSGGLDKVLAGTDLSQTAVDAAMRIRDRLGFAGEGTPGIYLCHSFCELGATPLSEVLDQLHEFLVANPDQVVVVINEDTITPKDFVAAVEKAGLADMAYRGPVDGQWPTLQEMIDSGQRVVFLAEQHAGAASWYRVAYGGATQETPYTFRTTGELTNPHQVAESCKANRGTEGAPLFLLNHWVSTDPIPLPSDAAKVNAYEPLLRRARECERIRGQIPNLIAVNFYRQGDLFGVVDTLNGVDDRGRR